MPPRTSQPHLQRLLRTLLAGLLTVLGLVLLAGCGGSADPQALLRETFTGSHNIRSGRLSFNLALTPTGSQTLKTPITLSFGGPFQSLGTGKVPASNFNITLTGLGHSASVGILSTGSSGFVTLQGAAYQLPASTFQQLQSSFGQVKQGSGGSAGSGINALRWFTSPKVVGHEDVNGTSTTHIHSGVDVSALMADLSTLVQRAAAAGAAGTSGFAGGIPPATQRTIANSVQNPSVDVWTGNDDKTLRRLALQLNVPVTGQIASQLGGLSSLGVAFNLQYANLNQPQTITAPASVHSFAELQGKLRSFLNTIRSATTGAAGGAGAASGAAGSSGGASTGGSGASGAGAGASSGAAPSSSAAGSLGAYESCLQAAGTDLRKAQGCAPLLHK